MEAAVVGRGWEEGEREARAARERCVCPATWPGHLVMKMWSNVRRKPATRKGRIAAVRTRWPPTRLGIWKTRRKPFTVDEVRERRRWRRRDGGFSSWYADTRGHFVECGVGECYVHTPRPRLAISRREHLGTTEDGWTCTRTWTRRELRMTPTGSWWGSSWCGPTQKPQRTKRWGAGWSLTKRWTTFFAGSWLCDQMEPERGLMPLVRAHAEDSVCRIDKTWSSTWGRISSRLWQTPRKVKTQLMKKMTWMWGVSDRCSGAIARVNCLAQDCRGFFSGRPRSLAEHGLPQIQDHCSWEAWFDIFGHFRGCSCSSGWDRPDHGHVDRRWMDRRRQRNALAVVEGSRSKNLRCTAGPSCSRTQFSRVGMPRWNPLLAACLRRQVPGNSGRRWSESRWISLHVHAHANNWDALSSRSRSRHPLPKTALGARFHRSPLGSSCECRPGAQPPMDALTRPRADLQSSAKGTGLLARRPGGQLGNAVVAQLSGCTLRVDIRVVSGLLARACGGELHPNGDGDGQKWSWIPISSFVVVVCRCLQWVIDVRTFRLRLKKKNIHLNGIGAVVDPLLILSARFGGFDGSSASADGPATKQNIRIFFFFGSRCISSSRSSMAGPRNTNHVKNTRRIGSPWNSRETWHRYSKMVMYWRKTVPKTMSVNWAGQQMMPNTEMGVADLPDNGFTTTRPSSPGAFPISNTEEGTCSVCHRVMDGNGLEATSLLMKRCELRKTGGERERQTKRSQRLLSIIWQTRGPRTRRIISCMLRR